MKASRFRVVHVVFLLATLALAGAGVAAAQDAPQKIAVIDVGRILEESDAGAEALNQLKQLKDQKEAEASGLTTALDDLQEKIETGRLSLSEDKLQEYQAELERKVIELKRLEDDANRELQRVRTNKLGAIERQIMPVINQVGSEGGYTLIFNKFQSGLVFALNEVDITDQVLARFNETTAAAAGGE